MSPNKASKETSTPKNAEEELQQLAMERKWFELGNALCEYVHSSISQAFLYEFLPRMHPITIAEVANAYIENAENDPKDLIEFALESMGVDNKECTTSVQLSYCLYLIENGKLAGIEAKLYDILKESRISQETKVKTGYVAYRFYEKVGNYENAIEYLLDCPDEFICAEKACIYATISKRFFDFSRVRKLASFSSVDETLKSFFISLSDGKLTNKEKLIFPPQIASEYQSIVKEKAFLVGILSICAENSLSKSVSFQTFASGLNLDSTDSLIYLLIKALGIGLISGWIDSEEETFYFDTIMPREMTDEEVNEMKMKFVELRERVQKVKSIIQ